MDLTAAFAGIAPMRFAVAITIGRGIRYFGEGLLALWYGERAIQFIQENSAIVGLVLAVLLLVGTVGYWLWRKRQATR